MIVEQLNRIIEEQADLIECLTKQVEEAKAEKHVAKFRCNQLELRIIELEAEIGELSKGAE